MMMIDLNVSIAQLFCVYYGKVVTLTTTTILYSGN